MKPPFDLAAVEAATKEALAAGHRVLQTHRYAESDTDHVAYLLDVMDPKPDAVVVDAGCGIGEVARIMGGMRPDLTFFLVNVSMFQLSHCPDGERFVRVLDDCHGTVLKGGLADAVMYSSALCQMDIPVALAEAHRLLKPGGVLLINDMVRTEGDGEEMERAIAARVLTWDALRRQIRAAGFTIDMVEEPAADDSHFRGMLAQAGLEHLLDGVSPVVVRALKAEVIV